MKKIPTLFERDWNGDRSRVVGQINPACQWVADGEGVATRKIDGTCCLVARGILYKRRELKKGEPVPAAFVTADVDDETGKTVGWMPVESGPEDRWHREAWAALVAQEDLPDGTYELVGPKVQGNPEDVRAHKLIMHGTDMAGLVRDVPRTFDGLREWLSARDIEGIVWHHLDGRMAKIKLRDFGLKRGAP